MERFNSAMEVSPYKALALVPGVRVNVARERLLGARIEGGQFALYIVRETRVETASETRITHRGVRIVRFKPYGFYLRVCSDDCVMMKLPKAEVITRYGVRRTPAEERAREIWEQDCHRPGDDSRLGGRDSFSRAVEGYTPDAQVRNVWGVSTSYTSKGE